MMKFVFMMISIFMLPLPLYNLFFFFLIISLFLAQSTYVISMNFMNDYISVSLVLLTVWLLMISMQIQYHIMFKNLASFMCFFLFASVSMTFFSKNLLSFYFFFEVSLIPIFIIIGGWGYQPERIQAGIFMFFYTMTASLPFLLMIIDLSINSGMVEFSYLNLVGEKFGSMSFLIQGAYVMAFLVKFPIYMCHLWLPKAHVEAPVLGSMLLAGILLKLGGYGIIRLAVIMGISLVFKKIMSVAMLGSVGLSIICLSMSDMKVLIAYSSVIHMSMVILGCMSNYLCGVEGGMMMMLAHGLVSSGMFCGAYVMYLQSHTRSYMLNRGKMSFFPFFSLMWFLLNMMNFGGPFSLNLLSEIILIMNLSSIMWMNLILMMFMSLFSAGYSLILYSSTQHGNIISMSIWSKSNSMMEMFSIFSHIWPVVLLPLCPSFV